MTMDLTKESAPAAMTPARPDPTPRFVPAADIFETAEEYVVMAEMPGCEPQGIDVQFENGELSISGRVARRQAPASGWLAREYEVGDYYRTFNVTDSIQADAIGAEYQNGILTLRLPKIEAAKPRKIEVRVK
ncbi:MAG: Hsp20/alpha crystallin family protein [Planctomycetaceae bacterium]|nr:Hsp20/alpha crystallin family protein [Planctomycetaceae bacterium]